MQAPSPHHCHWNLSCNPAHATHVNKALWGKVFFHLFPHLPPPTILMQYQYMLSFCHLSSNRGIRSSPSQLDNSPKSALLLRAHLLLWKTPPALIHMPTQPSEWCLWLQKHKPKTKRYTTLTWLLWTFGWFCNLVRVIDCTSLFAISSSMWHRLQCDFGKSKCCDDASIIPPHQVMKTRWKSPLWPLWKIRDLDNNNFTISSF